MSDAKTIWLFRDILTKADVIRELFAIFNKQLEGAHFITHTGSTVDENFAEAPVSVTAKMSRRILEKEKFSKA